MVKNKSALKELPSGPGFSFHGSAYTVYTHATFYNLIIEINYI